MENLVVGVTQKTSIQGKVYVFIGYTEGGSPVWITKKNYDNNQRPAFPIST
jgi:hypothetical protein